MDSKDNVLTPGQQIRPPGDEKLAAELLKKLYGMTATKVAELNAYDDRNYHFICEESHENPHMITVNKYGYVMKIINSLDSRKTHVIEAQNEILIFLNQHNVNCPLPIKNLHGSYYSLEKLNTGDFTNSYVVRLLVYRPGKLLHHVPISVDLLRNVGNFTAKLDSVLMGFSHPAYDDHKTLWMLTSVPKLKQFTYAVKDSFQRDLAHEVIHAFERDVLKVVPKLEQGIIHGDLNEQNIVTNSNGTEIVAVIDFGDSHKTCLIFELAITLCYMILQAGNVTMGKYVVEGYQNVRRLTDVEKRILKTSVCARMCQSLVMGAYSYLHDPQNEYLLITQKSGWTLLKELWPISQTEILKTWGLMN